MRKLLLSILLLSVTQKAPAAFIDQSEAPFFPSELYAQIRTIKSFPTFWWHFAVVETTGKDFAPVAHRVCDLLSASPAVQRTDCSTSLTPYLGVIADWAGDLPVREGLPHDWKTRLHAAEARAGLPIPRDLLEVLRRDPFQSYEVLLKNFMERVRVPFPRVEGYFWDEESSRVVLAFLPATDPSDTTELGKLFGQIRGGCRPESGCRTVAFLGPHASALENRERIEQDLQTVSWVGAGILLLLFVFFIARKEWRLLFVFPPVLFGTALAAIATYFIFGNVHGLTLSFGGGIIGLVIDYGLMAALSRDRDGAWKSNWLGFLTTVVCLVIPIFSSIPLLRQLMTFSLLGFLFGYLSLYGMQRWAPSLFQATPLRLRLGTSPAKLSIVVACLAGVVAGTFWLRPDFNLRQLDYRSPGTREFSDWLFPRFSKSAPLFQVLGSDPFADSQEHLSWATQARIATDTPAGYLPAEISQTKHLASWRAAWCDNLAAKELSAVQQKLFSPFLERASCANLSVRGLTPIPAYLSHLHSSDGSWLTLWLPKTLEESESIKAKFPAATSLFDIVTEFPRRLSAEVMWMAPLSLFLVWLILFLNFKDLTLSLVGLLPFLSGVGLICWAWLALNLSVSFVCLVGGMMLLGLSVDYAVFAIDHFRHFGKLDDDENRTATALLYAAVTTIAGFLPLLFSEHTVLVHLGGTLTVGTLGTVLGAFWGIPAILASRTKKNSR